MQSKYPKDEGPYFARYLSITKPNGDLIFQFLIYGADEPGAFFKEVELFAKHNIEIRSISVFPGPVENGPFVVFSAFCDLSKADCIADVIVSELQRYPFVKKVYSADMKGRIFDKFLFPNLIISKTRIVLMRIDALLRMEKSLFDKMGSVGAAIMFDEGKVYGQDVLEQYRLALPGASPQVLAENIIDGLRATGWGLFRFRIIGEGFEVIVSDPPMLERSNYRENRFYYGAAAKVLEGLYGNELAFDKSSFDYINKKLTFRLKRFQRHPE